MSYSWRTQKREVGSTRATFVVFGFFFNNFDYIFKNAFSLSKSHGFPWGGGKPTSVHWQVGPCSGLGPMVRAHIYLALRGPSPCGSLFYGLSAMNKRVCFPWPSAHAWEQSSPACWRLTYYSRTRASAEKLTARIN